MCKFIGLGGGSKQTAASVAGRHLLLFRRKCCDEEVFKLTKTSWLSSKVLGFEAQNDSKLEAIKNKTNDGGNPS